MAAGLSGEAGKAVLLRVDQEWQSAIELVRIQLRPSTVAFARVTQWILICVEAMTAVTLRQQRVSISFYALVNTQRKFIIFLFAEF